MPQEKEFLAKQLKLFSGMLETVPVGVVMSDAKGKILFGNREMTQMVRHDVLYSEDATDYGEWVSYHRDGRRVKAEEYPLARIILDDEDHSELVVHYERGDKTRFWMRIIGEALRDEDGNLLGAAVACVDVDEEEKLKEAQNVLIGELNHRVKNAFSVTNAIVSRSLRTMGVNEADREQISHRLTAYAQAHATLVGTDWVRAPLDAVAKQILSLIDSDRIFVKGPDVSLPQRYGLTLSMAFYELATNAMKHGSLQSDDGRVDLTWEEFSGEDDGEMLRIIWREGGGPMPQPTGHRGFGSFITNRALSTETGGKVSEVYLDEGLVWTLEMPFPEREL